MREAARRCRRGAGEMLRCGLQLKVSLTRLLGARARFPLRPFAAWLGINNHLRELSAAELPYAGTLQRAQSDGPFELPSPWPLEAALCSTSSRAQCAAAGDQRMPTTPRWASPASRMRRVRITRETMVRTADSRQSLLRRRRSRSVAPASRT